MLILNLLFKGIIIDNIKLILSLVFFGYIIVLYKKYRKFK